MSSSKKLGLYWGSESLSFVESAQDNPVKIAQGLYVQAQSPDAAANSSNIPIFDEYTYVATARKVCQDNRFSSTDVYLSLPTKDIIIRSFMIPWMKQSEVKSVVEFEAKKYIPFNLKELAFSYYPLTIVEKNIKRIRLLFVAVRRDTLEKYTQILKQAGLNVTFSEPSSMSLVKALLHKKLIKPEGRVAILQKDKTEAKVLIVDKGIPQFVRDFQLTQNIVARVQDENDAIKMKLFSELKISLEFYARQYNQDRMDEIIILSSDESSDLMRSLQQELGMNVRAIELNSILGMSAGGDWGFLNAYGILLSDPKSPIANFNLSSAQLDASKKRSGSEISTGSDAVTIQLGFVCLALVFLTYLFFNMKVTDEQKRVNLLSQKHGDFASQTTEEIQAKIKKNKELLGAYKKVAINSEVTFFQKYLAGSLPKGVWLNNIVINYVDSPRLAKKIIPNNSKGVKSKDDKKFLSLKVEDDKLPRPTISFSGNVFAEDPNQQIRIVNNFLSQLRNDPKFSRYFDDISVSSIQQQIMGDKTVSHFDISCK